MPFAGYENFKDCVSKNSSKDDPEAYCAVIMRSVEGARMANINPDELSQGIKVEMEHTNDKEIAKQIALDHLNEVSDYYTRLKLVDNPGNRQSSLTIFKMASITTQIKVADFSESDHPREPAGSETGGQFTCSECGKSVSTSDKESHNSEHEKNNIMPLNKERVNQMVENAKRDQFKGLDDFGNSLNTRTSPSDISRNLSEEDSDKFYDALDQGDNKTLDELTRKSISQMSPKDKLLVKEGLEELEGFNKIQQERAKTTKAIYRFVSFSELDSYLKTGTFGKSSFEVGENADYKSFTFDPRNPYFRERDVLLTIPIDDELRKDLHPVRYSAFPRADVEKDDSIDSEKTSSFAKETEVRLPANTKVPKNLGIRVITYNVPYLTYGQGLKSSEVKKIKDKYSQLGEISFDDISAEKVSSLAISTARLQLIRQKVAQEQTDSSLQEDSSPVSWDKIQKWHEGLNESQFQHAVDPNRLDSENSLNFSRLPFRVMSKDQKKLTAVAYGFRHQKEDMTPVLGFDMQKDEQTWWDTQSTSMKQHIIDPHQIFPWSLPLCEKKYKDLTEEEKKLVDKMFALRHKEEQKSTSKIASLRAVIKFNKFALSASGSDLYDDKEFICTDCGMTVKIKDKMEHNKQHKISSTSDSDISRTHQAGGGFLSQAELKPKLRVYSPEELGYQENKQRFNCNTCKFFKEPNVCTFPMGYPANGAEGCCNEYQSKTGYAKTKFASNVFTASLDSVSDCGQFATYFLLAGDIKNGRGWGVTEESIPNRIRDFIGKPFVITTSQYIKGSPYGQVYDHPSTEHLPYLGIAQRGSYDVNDKKLIFAFQEKFAVADITSVFEKDGIWRCIVKKRPEYKGVPWPPFCSPAIYKEDPHEDDTHITVWSALHLAGLDQKPAYGAIALYKGSCSGTAGQCYHKLREASGENFAILARIAQIKMSASLARMKLSTIMSSELKDTQVLNIFEDTLEGPQKKKVTPFSDILKNVI